LFLISLIYGATHNLDFFAKEKSKKPGGGIFLKAKIE
jgi:hypothetical protein